MANSIGTRIRRNKGKSAFFLAVVVVLVIRIFAGDPDPSITDLVLDRGESSRVLVVVVHAFTNTREDMKDIAAVTRERLADADILIPNYNSGTFANTNLMRTAAQLDLEIQRMVDEKADSGTGYEEVILIGHSVGALLVRKAYLYSKGIASDHPYGARVKPTTWHQKVERIILFAGMNRGWSTSNMSVPEKAQTLIGRLIHKVTGLGKMIMSAERGAPFVTDLKLDWIRASNGGLIAAEVIQILGKDDTIAPLEEHKELMATPNFIFIPLLEGATHANVIELLPGGHSGEEPDRFRGMRKAAFQEALSEDISTLKARYGSNRDYLDTLLPTRETVEHVVFIMHGIRDDGEWLEPLAEMLGQAEPGIQTITSEYGYFPMARFLLFGDRERNVRWFVDQYSEALALYPNAERISFIGHSNGTYLLASALENYRALTFDRVYFAGSVVRSDFPWHQFVNRSGSQRVSNFRNDIAVDDWVVAWFPKLYQIISQQFGVGNRGFFNLGSGGFNGFLDQEGKQNVRFVQGGHGGALSKENIPGIVDFIVGEGEEGVFYQPGAKGKPNNTVSKLLDATSNIAWVVWLVMASVVFILGRLFVKVAGSKLGSSRAIAAYIVLIVVLLYSF